MSACQKQAVFQIRTSEEGGWSSTFSVSCEKCLAKVVDRKIKETPPLLAPAVKVSFEQTAVRCWQ